MYLSRDTFVKNSKLTYLAASALVVFYNWALYKLTYSFIHSFIHSTSAWNIIFACLSYCKNIRKPCCCKKTCMMPQFQCDNPKWLISAQNESATLRHIWPMVDSGALPPPPPYGLDAFLNKWNFAEKCIISAQNFKTLSKKRAQHHS